MIFVEYNFFFGVHKKKKSGGLRSSSTLSFFDKAIINQGMQKNALIIILNLILKNIQSPYVSRRYGHPVVSL